MFKTKIFSKFKDFFLILTFFQNFNIFLILRFKKIQNFNIFQEFFKILRFFKNF